ncbi:Holliday junction branch migration protein RuvA [Patescibacteria group bacterium]|nr:Holliday junction branch migration protein RuvA [Patescibacteria group bacterium]MBU1895946.1 Holliday junction branch migration protein RuvA [Patescibacteria group bacterium]
MISIIRGKIKEKKRTTVTVLTSGGVGYDVLLSPVFVAKLLLESEIEIITYMRVTDSAMDLYGFELSEEKDFFELLLSVSGVGPKGAMSVLAIGSLSDIKSAIGRGDSKYLSAVKGMGAKTAERLCVELKNKVANSKEQGTSNVSGGVLSEVIDGLVALGYSKEEARGAVQGVEVEGRTTEDVLKVVLSKKA